MRLVVVVQKSIPGVQVAVNILAVGTYKKIRIFFFSFKVIYWNLPIIKLVFDKFLNIFSNEDLGFKHDFLFACDTQFISVNFQSWVSKMNRDVC